MRHAREDAGPQAHNSGGDLGQGIEAAEGHEAVAQGWQRCDGRQVGGGRVGQEAPGQAHEALCKGLGGGGWVTCAVSQAVVHSLQPRGVGVADPGHLAPAKCGPRGAWGVAGIRMLAWRGRRAACCTFAFGTRRVLANISQQQIPRTAAGSVHKQTTQPEAAGSLTYAGMEDPMERYSALAQA